MHRIDCPTATPDNRFTEGDPTIPVAATTVTADWLNAVQEELAAVIAGAELSLDKANNAQLLQALHKILDLRAPLATLLRAGLMQPDGKTTTVDEDGLLSALGGNLLPNSEEWLTESGTFTAPVTSWYYGTMWGGGQGGTVATFISSVIWLQSGAAGAEKAFLVYLTAGQEVPVVIGAEGLGCIRDTGTVSMLVTKGGDTSFGDITAYGAYEGGESVPYTLKGSYGYYKDRAISIRAAGAGRGGGYDMRSTFSEATQDARNAVCNAAGHTGAGGGAGFENNKYGAGKGAPGSVHLCWHDPAKAAGPLPDPALLKARRMAPRASAAPVTVNLYDPETGQGSVWREEDAPAKLAEGLIPEEAWKEIWVAKAAEDYAAWLSSPDTEAQRFELLRIACEAKLTATDKLTTSDYPISDGERAAVTAYRKAIRELNHQPGAPWDGGGEATPWPVEPVVTKVQEA